MAKGRTIYYAGVMMTLGVLVFSVVKLSVDAPSLENRSQAGNRDNRYEVEGVLNPVMTSSCVITGWAADLDKPDQSLSVKVYLDGPKDSQLIPGIFLGTYQADHYNPQAREAYQLGGNYGFKIDLNQAQQMLKDDQPHTVYVYGVDSTQPEQTRLLPGSPQRIKCD